MASTENSWRGQDQLLNIVVQAERPELAEEKVGLSIFFWDDFFGENLIYPLVMTNSSPWYR
jgi:hypothetical protein